MITTPISMIWMYLEFQLSLTVTNDTFERFILINQWMNFGDAESYCQEHYGTHLAAILTQLDMSQAKLMCEQSIPGWLNETYTIQNQTIITTVQSCWVGLNKIQDEDQWVFTSGKILDDQLMGDWFYWAPSDLDPEQDCMLLLKDYKPMRLADHYCWMGVPAFICDSPPPTTSTPTRQTISPSEFPSLSPTFVTDSPSLIPSIMKKVEPVRKDEMDTQVDIKWIIITILSVCVFALVVLAIFICIITKLRRKHETIDSYDDDIEMIQFKNEQIENWLKDKCGLVQYLDNFVENGYDKLEMISIIDSTEELEEIGIKLKGHQKLILSEIIKLKENKDSEEGENCTSR